MPTEEEVVKSELSIFKHYGTHGSFTSSAYVPLLARSSNEFSVSILARILQVLIFSILGRLNVCRLPRNLILTTKSSSQQSHNQHVSN